MSLKVESDAKGNKFFRCQCGNSAFEIGIKEKKMLERPSSGVLYARCGECTRVYPIADILGYVSASLRGRYPSGSRIQKAS